MLHSLEHRFSMGDIFGQQDDADTQSIFFASLRVAGQGTRHRDNRAIDFMNEDEQHRSLLRVFHRIEFGWKIPLGILLYPQDRARKKSR